MAQDSDEEDTGQEEQLLARRARGGDAAAFSELVARYQKPVFVLCWRYLRGVDAEDVAQETFVKAFVNMPQFDPTRPLLPWLMTIARRLCLDRLKKRTPELDPDIEQAGEQALAERVVASRQALGRVQKALAGLPDGPRTAVVMYHFEGMAYRDIAASLNVPQGTVMTWLHRARAKLKASLEPPPALGEGRWP